MSYSDDIRVWHKTFNVPSNKEPVKKPDWATRFKIMSEEWDELCNAFVARDKVKALDGLIDVVVTAIGTADAFGWDFDEGWHRVLESNYSKLGPDGKVTINEHGKIQKGENYFPPDLKDLVK